MLEIYENTPCNRQIIMLHQNMHTLKNVALYWLSLWPAGRYKLILVVRQYRDR